MAQALLGGLLPAIYSGADQLKRGVYGLLTNPQEQAERAAQSLLQSRADRQALMARTFSNPDRPFQVTDQAGLAQLTDQVMSGELGFAPAGIFIGAGAKNFNKKAAFEASKMEKAGKSPEEIWEKTGTVRGLDNNWRQEISDKDIPVLSYGTAKELASYPQMQNVLGHKELYGNYGGVLSNAPVGVDEAVFTRDLMGKPKLGGASYNQRTNEYTVSPRPEGGTGSEYAREQKSGLIHELQHGVQKIEDWNRGGQVNYFNQQDDAILARDILNFRKELDSEKFKGLTDQQKQEAVVKQYKDLGISDWLPSQNAMNLAFDVKGTPTKDLENLVNLYGLDKRTKPYTPYEMYNNLAGEAEARLAQTRIDLTPEQRLENFPFKQGKFGLDINPDDALIWNEGADILRRKSLLNQGLLD
jgi:hypothetical protein